jgi:hypothetical protein
MSKPHQLSNWNITRVRKISERDEMKGYSIKVVDCHDDMYISIFMRNTTFLECGGFIAECRIGHINGIWAVVMRFSASSPKSRIVYA